MPAREDLQVLARRQRTVERDLLRHEAHELTGRPAHGLAFGYAMNRQGPGVFLNERGQGLVDAAYRALGCAGNGGGFWA